MELTIIKPLYGNLNRYWRRRRYKRLDNDGRSHKKLLITRFGGPRKWRIRIGRARRLRIIRVGLSPFKLWTKLKNAYINMMVNLAGAVGYLNTDNVFGAKRIPTSRQAAAPVVYSSDEVERRLIVEIYKALQILSANDHEVRAI